MSNYIQDLPLMTGPPGGSTQSFLQVVLVVWINPGSWSRLNFTCWLLSLLIITLFILHFYLIAIDF